MRSNNFVLKAHFGDTGPNIHLNKSFKADTFNQKWSSGPLNSDLFLHFSTEAKISFLDWNRLLFCPYPTMISLVLDHNQKCSMTSEFLLSTTPMAVYNWVANYFMSSLLCCQSIFFLLQSILEVWLRPWRKSICWSSMAAELYFAAVCTAYLLAPWLAILGIQAVPPQEQIIKQSLLVGGKNPGAII